MVSWHSPDKPMRDYLTKFDWLAAQQCLGMAWREMRAEPVSPDEAGRFRMQQGQEIGELARTLYPGGVLVSSRDSQAAATLTRSLIQDGTGTMFEAAALAAPSRARSKMSRAVTPAAGPPRIQNGAPAVSQEAN